jgi:hypothetical protein
VRSFREGIYSLVFKTRDLGKADNFLMQSKQLRPELDGVDSVVLGRNQAFGMAAGLTQRTLSNSSRIIELLISVSGQQPASAQRKYHFSPTVEDPIDTDKRSYSPGPNVGHEH